ncbi:MAG: hypothetical protein P4L57_02365 [Rhizomicrobium sp.]|nr:hypothetical protein [Rhizomicrobium sp.]
MKRGAIVLTRAITIGALLTLLVGVGGCSDETKLDKNTAASLILAEEISECQNSQSQGTQTVSLRGPAHDTSTLSAKALGWLGKLRSDPNAKLISRGKGRFLYGIQEYFTYANGGHQFLIDAFTLGLDDEARTQAVITTCVFVPTTIDIIDITADEKEKTARVTYRVEWQLSAVARQMTAAGLTTFQPPSVTEFSANLRRLDATGWRFNGRG